MFYMKRLLLLVAVLPLLAAAGCKAKMLVSQYPSFYDPKLQSVAVLPFGNATLQQMAGPYVTRRLVAALKGNGTYRTVLGPNELKARLDQAGLKLEPEATIEQVAEALRKLGGIEAVLTGTVAVFSTAQGVYVDADYYDDWGYGWGWGYRGYGYRRHHWPGHYYAPLYTTYAYTYTRARVAARATLWRVDDATQIHAAPRLVSANVQSGGETAGYPDEALAAATDLVVQGLLAEFAVVPRTLEVKVNETLKTAVRLPNGAIKETNDFRQANKELAAVLQLPKAAALNSFRLAITRHDSDGVLAEQEFVWSRQDRTREFTFPLDRIVQAGGTGKFDIQLYVDDRFVLKRDFQIKD